MNRYQALIFTLLLAAVVVFWHVLSNPAPLELPPELTTAGEESLGSAVGEQAAGSQPLADASAERSATILEEAEPAVTAAKHYRGADAIALTLLDAISSEPLPGATLYTFDSEGLSEFELRFQNLSKEEIVRAYGVRYIADAAGQVRVKPKPIFLRLLAETEDSIFFHYKYNLEEEDGTLLLKPNRRLWVEVVDASGKPMPEHPVSIYVGGGARFFQISNSITNADGRALFEDFDQLQSTAASMGSAFAGPGFVGFSEPEEGKEIVKVTKEVLDEGEVQIVSRATGSIEVRLLDADGKPVSKEGWGAIHPEDRNQNDRLQTYARVPQQDGKVVFPAVGLNQTLTFSFRANASPNGELLQINGPKAAGEMVKAELKLQRRHSLVGVILGANGEPIADSKIKVIEQRERVSFSTPNPATVETDNVGRFDYVVRDDDSGAYFGGEEDLVRGPNPLKGLKIQHQVSVEEMQETELAVSLPLEPQATDLGQIRLAQRAPMLAGLVVDQDGNPVKNVQIQLSYTWVNEEGRNRTSYLNDWSRRTDENGRFACYSEARSDCQYRIKFHHQDYQSNTQDVVLSPQVQRFEIVAVPKIYVEMLVDPGMFQSDFTYDLDYEGDRGGRISLRSTPDSNPGSIAMTIPGVANLPFTFEVRTQSGSVLYQSGELQLSPGEQLRPAELNPLDLRGRLKVFSIRCVDEQGKAVPAQVQVVRDGTRRANFGWGSGEARFVTLEALPTVQISADGYLKQVLDNVQEDRVVTMRKSMKAIVQIPEQYLKYRDGLVQLGGASYYDENGNRQRVKFGELDENGRAELYFPVAGEYTLYLNYTPRFGPERIQYSSRSHSRQKHQLSADGQVVVMTVDREELDADIDEFVKDAKEDQL